MRKTIEELYEKFEEIKIDFGDSKLEKIGKDRELEEYRKQRKS